MRRSLISTLALAALLPAGLWAQEDGDPEQRIAEALATAEAAGAPLEMLRLKQAEGKAKGVPIEQLAEVMERRAEALSAARAAMPESDAQAVNAGADAVEAGIGPEVLGYIETTVPAERRYVAVFALTELVGLGEGVEEAMQKVDAALANGPQALSDLPDAASPRNGSFEGFVPVSVPVIAGPPAGIPGPGSTPAGPPAGIPAGPPGGG